MKGVAGKANSLTRRSSLPRPHTSNSPVGPTLPLSLSSEFVSPHATLAPCLYPGIPAQITQQVRHQRDDRPTLTIAARRSAPPPPKSQPPDRPTPANIRPRPACRSFELVGACLVLTFPGRPPCGKRILIGSVVPVVDLRTRENTTRSLFHQALHSMPMQPALPHQVSSLQRGPSCRVLSRHGTPAGRTSPRDMPHPIAPQLPVWDWRAPLVSVVLGNEPACIIAALPEWMSGLGDVFDMRHRTIPEERLCAPFCPPPLEHPGVELGRVSRV